MRILLFLISRRANDSIVISSVIMSCISNTIFSFILDIIRLIPFLNAILKYIMNNNIYLLLSSVFAILLAVLVARIYDCKWISYILSIFTYKAKYDSVWREYINLKNQGTIMKIACKNGNTYMGLFDYCEENGLDSWFVLKEYITITPEQKITKMPERYTHARLLINLKDVELVELLYNTKKDIEEQT